MWRRPQATERAQRAADSAAFSGPVSRACLAANSLLAESGRSLSRAGLAASVSAPFSLRTRAAASDDINEVAGAVSGMSRLGTPSLVIAPGKPRHARQ